jgi:hypothetical protein
VPNAANDLFKRAEKGQPLPGWAELVSVLHNLCSVSPEEIFMVFDALDECEEHRHREHILDLIEGLEGSNLRILATSRSFPPDITGTFEFHPQIEIEATDSDIQAYLREKITKSKRRVSRFLNEALREHIIKTITDKSHGM